MKKLFAILIMCASCTINMNSVVTVSEVKKLANGKCYYKVHDDRRTPTYFMHECGRFNVGDTVRIENHR